MHAARFFDPHQPQLLLGLLVLAMAMLAMAALAPELGSLDLSLGDGGAAGVSAPTSSDAAPAWTTDPLTPPLQELRQP